MIADVPEVIHALTLAQAQTDAPGFLTLAVLDDHGIIIPPEAHFFLRGIQTQRDQVDHAVGKFSLLFAKPHITIPVSAPGRAGA